MDAVIKYLRQNNIHQYKIQWSLHTSLNYLRWHIHNLVITYWLTWLCTPNMQWLYYLIHLLLELNPFKDVFLKSTIEYFSEWKLVNKTNKAKLNIHRPTLDLIIEKLFLKKKSNKHLLHFFDVLVLISTLKKCIYDGYLINT